MDNDVVIITTIALHTFSSCSITSIIPIFINNVKVLIHIFNCAYKPARYMIEYIRKKQYIHIYIVHTRKPLMR